MLGTCRSYDSPQRPTYTLQPSTESPLGRVALPQAQEHLGKTGVIAIEDGRVAFGVRASLARSAGRSIDIPTYIWHPDATGTLMFEEVMRAAERGVRVRLLLDDMNTAGTDPTLALLASHPNIELRLYNPFVGRSTRGMGFLTDFTRLNHRMHNKSFTVDNAIAVVGGPQHRRRIFRDRPERTRRSRCHHHRRCGRAGLDRVRSVLEQPLRRTRPR